MADGAVSDCVATVSVAVSAASFLLQPFIMTVVMTTEMISARALTTMSKVRFRPALKGSSRGVVRSWISLMDPMLSMSARVGISPYPNAAAKQ